nr:MAG TPA: bacterial toxin [Caudoviricetes sp.]
MDKYQNIKYNKGNEWDSLRDHYFVKSRLKDGRYGSVINADKQAPHMKNTAKPGKSYFNDDVDIQGLFDKYAGTGVVETNKNGRMNKEKIMTDSFLGFDYRTGLEVKGFKIHHSVNRTHLVPWKGES